MSFINVQSVLIYDSAENVHNFYLDDSHLSYVKADALTKKVESKMIERNIKEFDAFIDDKDMILLMCITFEQKLILYEIAQNQINSTIISDQLNPYLSDIHIFGSKDDLNVLYTLPDHNNDQNYRILQSRYNEGNWENKKVGQFISQNIMKNEIKVLMEQDGEYLGFVEYENNKSTLRVRKYDGISWSNDIIQIKKDEEIYWYDFQKNKEFIEIVYANRVEDQFVICYESYDINLGKCIKRYNLSNLSNCMHPIFISYQGDKWVLWVEMDWIYSCRLSNEKEGIEGVYRWKESKKTDFMKCRFSYNNETIKKKLALECDTVFASFPEYSLLGFGNLKGKAEAVTILKKKEDEGGKKMESVEDKKTVEKVKEEKVVKEEKKAKGLQEKLDELEARVDNIENYLRRRNRSIFGTKGK